MMFLNNKSDADRAYRYRNTVLRYSYLMAYFIVRIEDYV